MTLVPAVGLALAVLCWPGRRELRSWRGAGAGRRASLTPLTPWAPWAASRRRSPAAADQLLRLLDMVGAQVRAGAAPVDAWAAALDVVVPGGGTAAAEPMTDLLRWASRDAACGLPARSAAAAWRLAQRTGAPLADLLDTVGATVRADRADRAAVEAALAGPRATSRLLLALPVAGIALGELIGAAPLHVLLATPAGRACALTGLGLLVTGRWWMRRLVRTVEVLGHPPAAPGPAPTVAAAVAVADARLW
ncbi:MAG: type II secretion system F family protein [Angustibacter sp.]